MRDGNEPGQLARRPSENGQQHGQTAQILITGTLQLVLPSRLLVKPATLVGMRNLVAWVPVLALVLIALGPARGFAERLPTTVRPEHYNLAFDIDLARARFE